MLLGRPNFACSQFACPLGSSHESKRQERKHHSFSKETYPFSRQSEPHYSRSLLLCELVNLSVAVEEEKEALEKLLQCRQFIKVSAFEIVESCST